MAGGQRLKRPCLHKSLGGSEEFTRFISNLNGLCHHGHPIVANSVLAGN